MTALLEENDRPYETAGKTNMTDVKETDVTDTKEKYTTGMKETDVMDATETDALTISLVTSNDL